MGVYIKGCLVFVEGEYIYKNKETFVHLLTSNFTYIPFISESNIFNHNVIYI